MTTTIETAGVDRADRWHTGDRRLRLTRLAIGLGQGLALALLYRFWQSWSGTWLSVHPEILAPMILVAKLLPVVIIAGVGQLRGTTLAIWTVVAGVTLALFGWHDIARQAGENPRELTFPFFASSATALFIVHQLIVPADHERRLIVGFPAYFDAAWTMAIRLALSLAFAGACLLSLLLATSVLQVIGLVVLGDLIMVWCSRPLEGLAFAAAFHMTDVHSGLIRDLRTVGLKVLSWLLLVLTVVGGVYLADLPFAGLEGATATGSVTAQILAAAAGLIILINTAYRDGRPENLPPAALRIAVRVASVLLTPLMLVAAWRLSLHIGQYGLTPNRIIAVACTTVGLVYAIGYGAAAIVPLVRKGSPWMKALETTNITAAVLIVVAILALFSPFPDPARLSVADQVARLEGGAVGLNAFDYDFLRLRSGQAGLDGLDRLAAANDPAIADSAEAAQVNLIPPAADFRPLIGTLAGAPALPERFFDVVSHSDSRLACREAGECLAVLGPSVGFPQGDILLVNVYMVTVFSEDAESGSYEVQGSVTILSCEGGSPRVDARELLRQGKLKAAEHNRPALDTGMGIVSELFNPRESICSGVNSPDTTPPNPIFTEPGLETSRNGSVAQQRRGTQR